MQAQADTYTMTAQEWIESVIRLLEKATNGEPSKYDPERLTRLALDDAREALRLMEDPDEYNDPRNHGGYV